MKQNTIKQVLTPKQKLLRIAPLLVLPFITFLFWSLNGGRGNYSVSGKKQTIKGLNVDLPGARLKEDKKDKMQFYEQAAKDSARLKEIMRGDPYFKKSFQTSASSSDSDLALPVDQEYNSRGARNGIIQSKDPIEQKVYSRISQLNAQLKKSQKAKKYTLNGDKYLSNGSAAYKEDVDRLEAMMQRMSTPPPADTFMQQANALFDKIMDIQNPERVKNRIKQESAANKTKVYRVSTTAGRLPVSVLEGQIRDLADTSFQVLGRRGIQHNRFFGLESNAEEFERVPGSIRAVIDETQTVVSGAVVKFRLQDDVYVKGVLIPKGSSLHGISNLNGERLEVTIKSIRFQNYILPISLTVYGLDGLPGFYVPGSISRDVSKQSTDQAIQSLSLASLDPSLAAQATSAGIEAAKSLFSKKVKSVKLTLTPGTQVLLRDDNDKS